MKQVKLSKGPGHSFLWSNPLYGSIADRIAFHD